MNGLFTSFINKLKGYDDEEYYEDDYYENENGEDGRENVVRMDNRPRPIKKALEEYTICVMTPKSHEESPVIADALKEGNAVILNMEKFENAEEKKKMFHFATGVVYTIEGEIKSITEDVFVITPETVKINEQFVKNKLQGNEKENYPWRGMEPY